MSDTDCPTRRAVLGRAGGALALGSYRERRGYPLLDPLLAPRVRVLTRNLALGTRLGGLLDRERRQIDPAYVHERYRDVIENSFPTRARAIAAEIATARPALVGLQEVALIRTEDPGDYVGGSSPDAEHVEVDFLRALRRALDRELPGRAAADGYRPIAIVTNVDEELPAERPDGRRYDVRLTVRDVILARTDLSVRATETANYR